MDSEVRVMDNKWRFEDIENRIKLASHLYMIKNEEGSVEFRRRHMVTGYYGILFIDRKELEVK